MLEKQSKKPKGHHGGKRPNSGRPKGSTNKISPQTLMHDFKRQNGMTFSQFINKKIYEADIRGDHDTVKQYILGLAKYLVQDTQDIKVDHTTLGQSINTTIIMQPAEAPGWNEIPKSITYDAK